MKMVFMDSSGDLVDADLTNIIQELVLELVNLLDTSQNSNKEITTKS